MITNSLSSQAEALESLLPRLMRQLFTIDPEHPTAEMPLAQLRLCYLLMERSRSLTSIAEELGISVSAATQIADRLERTQIVERLPSSDDRRMKQLQLTSQGQKIMESRRQTRVEYARKALEHLPESRREMVLEALNELLSAASLANSCSPVEGKLTARLEK